MRKSKNQSTADKLRLQGKSLVAEYVAGRLPLDGLVHPSKINKRDELRKRIKYPIVGSDYLIPRRSNSTNATQTEEAVTAKYTNKGALYREKSSKNVSNEGFSTSKPTNNGKNQSKVKQNGTDGSIRVYGKDTVICLQNGEKNSNQDPTKKSIPSLGCNSEDFSNKIAGSNGTSRYSNQSPSDHTYCKETSNSASDCDGYNSTRAVSEENVSDVFSSVSEDASSSACYCNNHSNRAIDEDGISDDSSEINASSNCENHSNQTFEEESVSNGSSVVAATSSSSRSCDNNLNLGIDEDNLLDDSCDMNASSNYHSNQTFDEENVSDGSFVSEGTLSSSWYRDNHSNQAFDEENVSDCSFVSEGTSSSSWSCDNHSNQAFDEESVSDCSPSGGDVPDEETDCIIRKKSPGRECYDQMLRLKFDEDNRKPFPDGNCSGKNKQTNKHSEVFNTNKYAKNRQLDVIEEYESETYTEQRKSNVVKESIDEVRNKCETDNESPEDNNSSPARRLINEKNIMKNSPLICFCREPNSFVVANPGEYLSDRKESLRKEFSKNVRIEEFEKLNRKLLEKCQNERKYNDDESENNIVDSSDDLATENEL